MESGKEEEVPKEEVPKEELKEKEEPIASVWELLMNFRVHREALVLALDQKKISSSCTPEQMIGLLTETPQGAIVFSDDDLPLKGRDHHKALFIKAEVKGKMTCCVMVDNGSAINVCPLKILPKLGLTVDDLQTSDIVINTYDDIKRPVEGIFKALVKTGPIKTWVNLHMIDIPVTFAILIGRPWYHPLGGVPSTIH